MAHPDDKLRRQRRLAAKRRFDKQHRPRRIKNVKPADQDDSGEDLECACYY
jgi:hypothetical protein